MLFKCQTPNKPQYRHAANMIKAWPQLHLDKAFFTRPMSPHIEDVLHEIAHSLYFWQLDKKERLTKFEYGYKYTPRVQYMFFKDACIEGKVFALSALLAKQIGVPEGFLIPFYKTRESMVIFIHCCCKKLCGPNKFDDAIFLAGLHEYIDQYQDADLLKVWQEICDWYSSLNIQKIDTVTEYNYDQDTFRLIEG